MKNIHKRYCLQFAYDQDERQQSRRAIHDRAEDCPERNTLVCARHIRMYSRRYRSFRNAGQLGRANHLLKVNFIGI